MRTTRPKIFDDFPRLYEPHPPRPEAVPDPFDTMLTPSRDQWYAFVHGEVMDILERHDMLDWQKAREIMVLMERERGRPVAEER